MLDESAGGAKPCLSSNDAMLLKAMPPNSRLCQGKRRPRPGSFSRHRVPTPTNRTHCLPLAPKDAESREPSEDGGSEKHAFSEEDFLRLQGIVLELQQRCSLQQKELDVLRRPNQVPSTHAEVQTEACGGPIKRADSASFEQVERQELDALHREVGEKSRELRKTQDTVRLLRSELQQQQQVSEQYRSQVDMLEEQLRITTMQSRQQASSPKISLGLSRTSSARLTRAWQDSPRKRNGSLLESDLPSMCGHQASREGRAEKSCHDSSDEDDWSSAEIGT